MGFDAGHTVSKEHHAKAKADAAADPDVGLTEAKEPVTVRRFSMVDMHNFGESLLERMAEKWPHMSKVTHAGRMRQLMDSNDYLFITTPGAVGLATRTLEGLDPAPVVLGIFAWPFSAEEYVDRRETRQHILALCRKMEQWGREMRAREFRPGEDMTISQGTLLRILGYQKREQIYRRLL